MKICIQNICGLSATELAQFLKLGNMDGFHFRNWVANTRHEAREILRKINKIKSVATSSEVSDHMKQKINLKEEEAKNIVEACDMSLLTLKEMGYAPERIIRRATLCELNSLYEKVVGE